MTISNVEEYLSNIPEERKKAFSKLYNILKKKLPKGFEEGFAYGMITYCVPHSIYPAGYHVNPAQALPFISLASQKNFIALYHMGVYAMPEVLNWFTESYPKYAKTKLDMGKSCIRFKRMDDIPFELIEELAGKISVEEYLEAYEKNKP